MSDDPQHEPTFVATAPATLVSSQDLELSTRRSVFVVLAGFTFVIMAIYGVASLLHGHDALAVVAAVLLLLTLACAAVAWRTHRFGGPLRALAAFLFIALGAITLQQGSQLPSAGWWLSVIPFILAGAGLYRLAIAAVLAFIAIVTALNFGPMQDWLPPPQPVEPWRQYIAVIGSELLALSLIIVAMLSRARLANALERARAAASEAGAVKARFLANMSHEIRTPLTAIIGAAELLDSPQLSDAQRRQIVALQQRSTRTLLALVNDVLDFARLEAGKVRLETRPVNLRGIVFEANELFSLQAFGKGIELSSSCNPDVPGSAIGDPLRLRQVVDNLVGNAVKFTAKGGVHIHLSLDPLDARAARPADGRRWLRIEVVDSGPGISTEQLQRLFGAFTQADDSTTRRFGGSGLGLSIAQQLARLMGGRIEVRSVVGQGSSFALVVPLAVDAAEPPPAPPVRSSDVLLAVANRGLERHLRSLLHELKLDPVALHRLPTAQELEPCRLLLLDAPLLQGNDAAAWFARHGGGRRRMALLTPLGSDIANALPADVLALYKPVSRQALEAALGLRVSDAGAPAPASIAAAGAARPLHVLVAEDNPVNQVVVQAMLAELGATVVVAHDGQEALDCIASEPFDLVLMDVHMPVMDGLTAAREIRARERQAGPPRLTVLAMTAATETEVRADCAAAGMDGMLAKPFSLTELRQCLDSHVKPSQRPDLRRL